MNPHDFEDIHEYPVSTATHKAVDVYERLVVRSAILLHYLSFHHYTFLALGQIENPDDGPDLVIGADTVVLTHAQPSTSQTSYSDLPQTRQELLEKPDSKADNLRMLLDLNGSVCEVVTGVTVRESSLRFWARL